MEKIEKVGNFGKNAKNENFQNLGNLGNFNEVKIEADYDGFELESYIDLEDLEFLGRKKNSFTQRIENITEFCLSRRSFDE